jgi:hypothetical protein
MAYLKRIEKDRVDQSKKRETDMELMSIKLKNIQNDIVQKQSAEIRSTLESLKEKMSSTSRQMQGSRSRVVQSLDRVELNHSKVYPSDLSFVEFNKRNSFKPRRNSFNSRKSGGGQMERD